jgi:hypothetical protein
MPAGLSALLSALCLLSCLPSVCPLSALCLPSVCPLSVLYLTSVSHTYTHTHTHTHTHRPRRCRSRSERTSTGSSPSTKRQLTALHSRAQNHTASHFITQHHTAPHSSLATPHSTSKTLQSITNFTQCSRSSFAKVRHFPRHRRRPLGLVAAQQM